MDRQMAEDIRREDCEPRAKCGDGQCRGRTACRRLICMDGEYENHRQRTESDVDAHFETCGSLFGCVRERLSGFDSDMVTL